MEHHITWNSHRDTSATAGVTQLLDSCAVSLAGSAELFLELLFTLAQDDWPQAHALHSHQFILVCFI